MSCNGCRVLRKGCSDTCILRSCLQWLESSEAQGHATVFVAKFFGRAGMMSFISAVPESQRPALFQSLLYEACGRTLNPVFGAVGLLWSGNWGLCQAAVETVLKGGSLKPLPSSSSIYASTEHVQPLSSSTSQAPMLMNSTKRSHCTMDSINDSQYTESKRLRSIDQHEMLMHLRVEPASMYQEELVSMLTKPSHVTRQEEKTGQLVAPVARRISRPQTGYNGLAAMAMREHKQQQPDQGHTQACEEEQERQSYGTVELDLALNSYTKRGGPVKPSRIVRTSSPSSFSINSEGSVISTDSADFSACGLRTLAPALHEGREFFHLL